MTGCNSSGSRVDGEQYGALESMMLSHNLSQQWQCFFTTVFIVATDEDDVFPFAWAIFSFEGDPLIIGVGG